MFYTERLKRITATLASALLVLAVSCRQESESASLAQPASPPPISFSEPRQWPAAYGNSTVWKQAALGDPIDLARLADHHTPQSLVELVAMGGLLGSTALAALPYLEDPFATGYGLCELAPRASGRALQKILQALVATSQSAPRSESVDRPRAEHCYSLLQQLVAQKPDGKENPKPTQTQTDQTIADLASSALTHYRH